MGRSKWKFNFIAKNLFKNSLKNSLVFNLKKIKIICYSRSSIILPNLKYLYVHKGNTFVKLVNTKYLNFQKLGFFSFTRRPYVYKLKK